MQAGQQNIPCKTRAHHRTPSPHAPLNTISTHRSLPCRAAGEAHQHVGGSCGAPRAGPLPGAAAVARRHAAVLWPGGSAGPVLVAGSIHRDVPRRPSGRCQDLAPRGCRTRVLGAQRRAVAGFRRGPWDVHRRGHPRLLGAGQPCPLSTVHVTSARLNPPNAAAAGLCGLQEAGGSGGSREAGPRRGQPHAAGIDFPYQGHSVQRNGAKGTGGGAWAA